MLDSAQQLPLCTVCTCGYARSAATNVSTAPASTARCLRPARALRLKAFSVPQKLDLDLAVTTNARERPAAQVLHHLLLRVRPQHRHHRLNCARLSCTLLFCRPLLCDIKQALQLTVSTPERILTRMIVLES